MNRLLLLGGLFLAAAAAGAATRPPPKLLVQANLPDSVVLEDRARVVAEIENRIARRITDEFPCARIQTRHAILNALDGLRQLAWYGRAGDDHPDYQKDLAELGKLMDVDYLVVLEVTPLGGRWVVNAKWLDQRKVNAIARRMETAAPDAGALKDAADRLALQMVDDAAYFEICGYTGPVRITIHSSRQDQQREERPASCNGQEQTYVKTTELNRTSDTVLDVERTARFWATGSLEYAVVETADLEEMDPCHRCPSGSQGVRIYTERRRTEIRISGFSEQSGTAARRLTDVRLYLKFDRNGTYRLELESASKLGTKRVKVERKAEGVCDTRPEPVKEDETVGIDVPFAHIFGPFPGSPRDKRLSAKQDFRTEDPVTKEVTTISVEFQLQRD